VHCGDSAPLQISLADILDHKDLVGALLLQAACSSFTAAVMSMRTCSCSSMPSLSLMITSLSASATISTSLLRLLYCSHYMELVKKQATGHCLWFAEKMLVSHLTWDIRQLVCIVLAIAKQHISAGFQAVDWLLCLPSEDRVQIPVHETFCNCIRNIVR